MRDKFLREATVTLALARLAVRWAPPARILAWARRRPSEIKRFRMGAVSWITWSIETIGPKPWMNAACLPRALAAQAMLRRRGIASRLCLGVTRERDDRALSAHAWLELGDSTVIGGEEALRHTKLVEFGGDRA
jgi:Transglutaminase-like superfamily